MQRNKNVENAIVSAFWSDAKGKNKSIILTKKIGKLIWRFTKLAIFLFLIVLGLWGCVSLYSEPSVLESTNIGQGFEFGLPYTYTFFGISDKIYEVIFLIKLLIFKMLIKHKYIIKLYIYNIKYQYVKYIL